VQFPTSRTSVAFDISGLGAWQRGDSLQIVSPNAGMTMEGPENVLSAYPSIGSTTISGQSFDWKANFAPIIDSTRGDTTWITQMVANRTADAKTYYTTLGRAGIARGFTVSDGRPAVLSAALAPVAQDRHLALHWKGSQFAALASQAGPGAEPAPTPALAVRALPDLLARNNSFFSRYYVGLPTLVELGPISGSADFDQSIAYGDPFPSVSAAWTEFVTLVYAMPVPVPTPQGNGSLSAMVVAAIPVSSLAGNAAITPSLSPVRNAKIDGQSLDTPRTGVGTSPTITWEAPAIGTSTSYTVTVHAVQASDLGVTVTRVATLYTTSPSLKLPDSVITPASSYVLTITAIAATGADHSRPFVGALPYASADYVTARLTP
jgi:hypothetical protein